MRRVWRLPEFKDVQRLWDDILRDDGFLDIEVERKGERELKAYADAPIHDAKMTKEQAEIKAEYFTALSQLVEKEAQFEDESDRIIMERTASGCMIWEISKELREKGLKKSNRDTIRYVRRRYENRWGVRNWKPEDMVSRQVKPISWSLRRFQKTLKDS